jgi:hypothetical protein
MAKPEYKGKEPLAADITDDGADAGITQLERRFYWLHVLEYKVLAVAHPSSSFANVAADGDVCIIIKPLRGSSCRRRAPKKRAGRTAAAAITTGRRKPTGTKRKQRVHAGSNGGKRKQSRR